MSLKRFVNTPDLWSSFVEEIDQTIFQAHRDIEQLEGNALYRKQGEIQVLRRLKQLRDKVNAKDKNV